MSNPNLETDNTGEATSDENITSGPVLETDTFSLDFLTSDPRGFEIETVNTVSNLTLADWKNKIGRLDEQQLADFRRSVNGTDQRPVLDLKILANPPTRGEMQMHEGKTLLEAREQWMKSVHELEEAKAHLSDAGTISKLESQMADSLEQYNSARDRYKRGMIGKMSLDTRKIKRVGNKLLLHDVSSVPFNAYKFFIKDPEVPKATGASVNIITAPNADGIRYLIIQHRSSNNEMYGDVAGASAAGYVDAHPSNRKIVEYRPDTDFILNAIGLEIGEELGLSPEDFNELRVVGFSFDKVIPHTDIMCWGELNISADKIQEISRKSNKNKKLNDLDFSEKYLFMEASPEAIYTLLTRARCPIPSTHLAGFATAGYFMVLKSQGLNAANRWMRNLQAGIDENNAVINDIVKQHFLSHPDELQKVKVHRSGKAYSPNPIAYTPFLTPAEQGLPDVEEEFVRLGLIR